MSSPPQSPTRCPALLGRQPEESRSLPQPPAAEETAPDTSLLDWLGTHSKPLSPAHPIPPRVHIQTPYSTVESGSWPPSIPLSDHQIANSQQRVHTPRPIDTPPPHRARPPLLETDFQPGYRYIHLKRSPCLCGVRLRWFLDPHSPPQPPCAPQTNRRIDAAPPHPLQSHTTTVQPAERLHLQSRLPPLSVHSHRGHAATVKTGPERTAPARSFDDANPIQPRWGPPQGVVPSVHLALKQGRGIGFRPGHRSPGTPNRSRTPRPRLGRVMHGLP